MSEKRAQPPFTVQRHSGEQGATWRVVGTFDNEADAKSSYRKARRGMRSGGIALCDSRGITLTKVWLR